MTRGVVVPIVLCCLFVVSLAVAPVAVVAAADGSSMSADDSSQSDLQNGNHLLQADEDDNSTENETTPEPHRNPDEVQENGDVDQLQSVLGNRLAERLGDSAISISESEYNASRDVLGDEYDESLSQYVDVEGDVEDEENSKSNRYEQAKEDQQELTKLLEEYDETYDEYQAAREAGETERARELARELDELADRIIDLGGQIETQYDEIENSTGTDFTNASDAISNTTRRVSDQQSEVREAEFTETELSITVSNDSVSFTDPATIRGRLETENGTAVGNESIRLTVGSDTLLTETDSTGAFSVEYRPVRADAKSDNLDVRYRPRPDSEYLGSNASFGASISQTNGTLVLDEIDRELSRGDDATVEGRLLVDGDPVSGVRLDVLFRGAVIDTVTTDDEGRFVASKSITSTVSSGEAILVVRPTDADAAVTATPVSETITVVPTETSLIIDVDVEEDAMTVSGRLMTLDGEGITGSDVSLHAAGTTMGSVATTEDGEFEAVFRLPSDVDPGETVVVEGAFDGGGTIFTDATATEEVTIPGGGSSLDPVSVGSVVAVLVAALLGGWLWWRRKSDGDDTVSIPEDGSDGSPDVSRPSASRRFLETARDQLAADEHEAAVRSAFAGVRTAFTERTKTPPGATHWEFYNECRRHDVSGVEALEELTTIFERAVFDPRGVSETVASRALDAATAAVDTLHASEDDSTTAD